MLTVKRCVLIVSFLVVAGIGLLAADFMWRYYEFTQPHPEQSSGTVTREEAIAMTISGTLPESASGFQYARSSSGFTGRFRAYTFSAPLNELRSHAQTEFNCYEDKLSPTISENQPSPFDESWVKSLRDGHGVRLDWLDPAGIGKGVEYLDEHCCFSPLIFIDEENNTLYFVMSY